MRSTDADVVADVMARSIDTMRLYTPQVRAYMAGLYTPDALSRMLAAGTVIRVAVLTTQAPVDVASREQRIVGAGCFADGRIFGMYVLPGRQRAGAGSQLLVALEREGAAGSIVRVEANFEAVPFYEKHGYVFVAKEEVTGNVSFAYWRLVKTL